MRTPVKVAAYAAALAATFAAAVGVGSAVGSPSETSPDSARSEHAADHGSAAPAAAAPATATPAATTPAANTPATAEELPGGLLIAQHGYRLQLDQDVRPAGPASPVALAIVGPDGQPLTDYETSHDEDLHVIAVRRDLTGFQHVHPDRGGNGTWRTALRLTPGEWRVFADFVPSGHDEGLTLGADLSVAGSYRPQELPVPTRSAQVDGYTVTLDGGLRAGEASELALSVSKNGRPVTDLQPYLGAYGHLVALRDGDLAYLHVHPGGAPGDGTTTPGPDVTFHATAPSEGTYRLFLDFRHAGVVRTAEFSVRVGGVPAGAPTSGSAPEAGHGSHDAHGS